MKKTILLLALVLGCAMLNGQKIQMDNGKWYKFRLTKEQMREVMIGKKQDDKREQSYLRDLVGVYDADSICRETEHAPSVHDIYSGETWQAASLQGVADTAVGLWAWVKQEGGKIKVWYVNNPPFEVRVSGDMLMKDGRNTVRRVAVSIEGCRDAACHVSQAKVTVRDNKRHTIKRLKWSERDSAFVGVFSSKKSEMQVVVELDGYVRLVYLDSWYGYRYRNYYGRVYEPEMSWGVTDKNMYKPGETVKWKFVLTDKKGKPCKGKAVVMLNGEVVCMGDVDKNGAIAGETQLTDSFKLRSGEWFYMRANIGDVEAEAGCQYKDYELKSLNATAVTENVTRGDTIRVKVSATDERDKPVMDARVWGKWMLTSVTEMDGDLIRLGETNKIDTVEVKDGKAVLEIPTKDFPMADVRVEVLWNLRTAEGEEKSGGEYVECKRRRENAGETEHAPSVHADEEVHIIKYDMADSVGFSFNGKGKRCNWVIYRKGKEIASGIDSVLEWRRAEAGNADYVCVVSQPRVETEHAPSSGRYVASESWSASINHSADALKVRVEQRRSVKPGEEDAITVVVTDSKGRPVEGVDLTALAATSKLRHNVATPELRCGKAFVYSERNAEEVRDNRDYCLKDSVVEGIIDAAGVQYWRMVSAKDSVVVVETPSKVGSQIVPVLVRNRSVLDVAFVIVNGVIYVPSQANRYAIVPRVGENDIAFCTGDSMFSTTIAINDSLPVKRWLGIPACRCEITKMDKQQVNRIAYNVRNSVIDKDGRGCPFLVRDGEIIPLNGKDVVGLGGVAVGAVSMDSVVSRAAIELGNGRTVTLYHEPTVIKYEIASGRDGACSVCTKQRKSSEDGARSVSTQHILLDDSVCTVEELRQRWIEKLDGMRRTERSTIPSGYRCEVRMVENSGEMKPLQVCYREKDSAEWLLNGNSGRLRVPAERDIEVVFMYEGGVTRRLNMRVGKGENVVVRSSCRNGEGVVDKALEREMRLRMERLCAERAEKYKVRLGAGGDMMNELVYDFGNMETEEDMIVAYGMSARKMAKPMNSVRIRGIGSVDSYEEEVSFEYDAAVVETERAPSSWDIVDIRDEFNDVAFFVTDCHTDKNGRAVMRIKYPDDLTNWSEWFVAIKGKQRGMTRSSVKAEKEHEAKLNMPRFAVEGDTVGAVGVGVDRVTGEHRSDTLMGVAQYLGGDAARHVSTEGDSLCMQYTYKSDGERRCVPIYRQGLQMIEGTYQEIDSDAVVRLAYNPEYGEMKVGVFGDAREMMMRSVERVAAQDWCEANDFMANRLRALRMLPKNDSIEKIMTQIEKKLMKNRCANGMWSWWGSDGRGSLWVTQRVLEAIGTTQPSVETRPASSPGTYDVGNSALETELALRREQNRGKWYALLDIAKVYKLIGEAETAREIANGIPDDSIRNVTLRIDKQMLEGREVRFDTMRHTTYTEGSFYSVETRRATSRPWYCVTCEEVLTTLQAYRYFIGLGDREECKSIKRWLLQYGFKGFMSERVEMEIVSAIWSGQGIGAEEMLWQMSVGGKVIEKLPYHTTVSSAIDVEYKGRRDVYISTEQNWWNRTPVAQGNGMSISTTYVGKDGACSVSTITVTVNVEHTAENVIISVPVPAGCSYADNQRRSYSETFREEYRDRVNIYCYQLREGRHEFKVRLNERYPGVYTLNPAQIRLVDYPVFNANNEVRRVVVK